MQYVENAIFVIIGEGDVLDEMKQRVKELKLENCVKFLGKISPKKLQQLTPLADLGISLEEDRGLNYRFALPNKLFDYIQAKIPVIVSDLPEMKKVVKKYNIGTILYNRSSENLRQQINEMLDKEKQNWQNSLSKAAKELIWEKEQDKLKNIFNNLK